MLAAFQDLSIRHKLMRICMQISTVVLLLASLGFVAYELVTFRETMVQSLSAQAEIIGINTASAVLFNDPASAVQTMTALRIRPNIVSAGIYTNEGKLFARYVRSDGTTIFRMPEQMTDKKADYQFDGGYLFLSRPIVTDGDRVGTVYIQSDLSQRDIRMKRYAAIVFGLLAISLVTAYGVSSRLQKIISGPILHLAETAKNISEEKNYSIRATAASRDEIGQLVNTFNEMLTQIQVREVALQKAHDDLELRVEERTLELQQEIVERKRGEAELKRAESFLDSIVENIPNMVFVKGVKDLRFLRLNKAGEELLGYAKEDLIGKNDHDFFPKEQADFFAAKDQQVLNEGRLVDIPEESVQTRSRGARILHTKKIPVHDAEGKPLYLLGISEDITERKQAEESLRKSEEKYRALFDSIDVGVCTVQVLFDENDKPVDYRFLEVNPSFEKQTGIQNAVGRTMREIAPLHEEHWFEIYGKIALTGKPERFENQAAQLHRWYDVYAFRIGEPQKRLVAIHFKNITERKLAEDAIRKLNDNLQAKSVQLEAANKELEAFSYSVSHDLRAPLRHVDGFSQILLEDHAAKLDDEGRRYLQQVREASQRMAQLIDDLLNLSRVTRAELRWETVDLSGIVETVAEGLKKEQPDRTVEFVIEKDVKTKGDARLLRVLLDNLLGNAWKYTGKRPQSRIEFGRTARDGKTAYFVRDNGAGFDMTYVHKLFGAFQRLHTVSEFPGTGIGLATVQRIAHKHGGRVWAEGNVDQGATFYFAI